MIDNNNPLIKPLIDKKLQQGQTSIPSFKSTFTVPPVKFGDYTLNLRTLIDEMKQKEGTTGIKYSPEVTEAIMGESLGIGGKAASEAVMSRKEEIFKGKQIEIAEFQTEQQRKIAEQQLRATKKSGGGTVICTELCRQGLLPEEVYRADCEFGKVADQEALMGYRMLAYPLSEKMKDSALITKLVSLLAIPTAYEFAHRVNPDIKGSLIGKVVYFLGRPVCKVYYRLKRRVQWQTC